MTRPVQQHGASDPAYLREHVHTVHDLTLPDGADDRYVEQTHRADHHGRDVRHEHEGLADLPLVRDLAVNPDRACPHEHFTAIVEVNRLTDGDGGPVHGFVADLTIHCAQCDEPFRFHGVPAGMLADRPSVSLDEATVHLPLRPASSDPDFGLGIPGFAITYREGPAHA